MKRAVVLVADGLGVGELPDAKDYGDAGANTLAHTASFVGGLSLPNLEKLGLGLMGDFAGIKKVAEPQALISRLAEKSAGKDTTTGHWEIAGLVTTKAFALFPEGFPKALNEAFIKAADIPGILGNKAASGTHVIDELGEEHMRTGKPIVYTSGDSVFQIAAHEETFGLKRLHKICEIARELTKPYQIGRVIARPFIGNGVGSFKRTENRRDYVLAPPKNLLDAFVEQGLHTYSVGKIEDIFDHRAISFGNHTGNNLDSLKATESFLEQSKRDDGAFIFTNLVDFDMLYGHRRDAKGYAKSLMELDSFLPRLLSKLTDDDCLIITGDHGCDPTYRGTDHTREYVPLVAYSPNKRGGVMKDRESFCDIAATIALGFHLKSDIQGSSFLEALCSPRK